MKELKIKIGSGYDIHRLVRDRDLILGGVKIDYHLGLDGHSDADVLIHAICDAILGAIGAGDIGDHFPDNDPQYKDISSINLLKRCKEILDEEKYEIGNIDSLIFAQEPKISPYKQEMKQSIAKALGMDTSLINIKATTTERLGFIGKKEGISAQCTLLIYPLP